MKVVINIEKKHVYLISGLLILFAGMFAVNAFGGIDPAIMGHSEGEINLNNYYTKGEIDSKAKEGGDVTRGSGDVNNDGALSIGDRTLILQYIDSTAKLTAKQLTEGDVDGDGIISNYDVQIIEMMEKGNSQNDSVKAVHSIGFGSCHDGLDISGKCLGPQFNVAGKIFTPSLISSPQINSAKYCDADGVTSCYSMSELVALINSGSTATSDYLVYNQHTKNQCTGLGGTITSTPGQNICKFDSASCPTGWVQYENWGTTVYDDAAWDENDANNGYCTADICIGDMYYFNFCSQTATISCSYGKHDFSNVAIESCATARDPSYICTAKRTQTGCY